MNPAANNDPPGKVTIALARTYRNRLLIVAAIILIPLGSLTWLLVHDLRVAGALAEVQRSYDRLDGEFNALAARSREIDADITYVRYDTGAVLAVPADAARNLRGQHAKVQPIAIVESHQLFPLKQQMEQRWAAMLGLEKNRLTVLDTAYSPSLALHFSKTNEKKWAK
ncbi:MAG: hypothetical protein AAB263_16910 [Planctomycetota bacterium]